ncbi:MAG: hypothetical protein RDU20_04285 [Desulfomonilaceae bacterium]|nr:hypothetical protein [Desulfomonilaceae bacterium]
MGRQSKKGTALFLAGVILVFAGCSLPFPGPYQGTVTDSESGKHLEGAKVEAEWWCHDNPLPDGPGSFFVRASTVTDAGGAFVVERETRRGGMFGCSFVLKIAADGYIPAALIQDPSGVPLPASTKDYPFVHTSAVKRLPPEVHVRLTPAVPILLKALKSPVPLHQEVARERLVRLLGVDHEYDADKWEAALGKHPDDGGSPGAKEAK